MFAGFAELGGEFTSLFLTRGAGETPVVPDAAPTWRVYGPDGPMVNGAGTAVAVAGAVGLYRLALAVAGGDGYELGTAYRVLIDYTAAGTARAADQLFVVT